MVNKRGYSFGAEHPIHYEERGVEGWAVFDARTDEDKATGLQEWQAMMLAMKLNDHLGPSAATLDAIDTTP
jgi:hypothetical protein